MFRDVRRCDVSLRPSALVLIEQLEARLQFADTVATFTNPLEVKLADPSVLTTARGQSLYYLSGTGSARFVSNDLVNWRRQGEWVSLAGTGYGNIWASEVVERKVPGLGLQFFYYFSATKAGSGNRVIGVARAGSPDSSFAVVGEVPLNPADGWIDPHVLTVDRQSYLYVTRDLASNPDGNSRILVARLGRDMTSLLSQPQVVVQQSESWESTWIEGAAVVRHNEVYYLTYSSNCFCGDKYSVGVATSRSPTGPFVKDRGGPILRQQVNNDPDNFGHTGPGHNGFVRSPDGTELFMIYHTHVSSELGGVRQVNIDRVTFQRNGNRGPAAKGPPRLQMAQSGAPTKTPQPYPAGAAPTPTAVDDAFDGAQLRRDVWRNIWGDQPSDWRMQSGRLVLTARGGQVFQEQNTGANVFLQQAPASDWTISTSVTFDPQQNFEHAFLTVWQDSNNYVMLKHVWAGGRRIEASHELDQAYQGALATHSLGTTVFLQIRKIGNTYTQFYGANGVNWTQVGAPVTLPLLDVKVGLGAWIPGSDRAGAEARFEFFDVNAATTGATAPKPEGARQHRTRRTLVASNA